MMDLVISPYRAEDSPEAVALEEECVQGQSIAVRFRRPTFHARSEVYENYNILCGRIGGKLIGTVAAAIKFVRLHGEGIKAAYIYDVRVHPEWRKFGVAKRLVDTVLQEIGNEIGCIYTLIAGQNERALGLARRTFGARVVIPMTYVVIPVYKRRNAQEHVYARFVENHVRYLRSSSSIDFLPQVDETRLVGYVSSLCFQELPQAGCSIWTNQSLLQEEIVSIPRAYRFLDTLLAPLRPLLRLPSIPQVNRAVRSWFLFDLYAGEPAGVKRLLGAVNDFAYENGRQFLYLLFQNSDPMLHWVQESVKWKYRVPYYFLAKGRLLPRTEDRVYIDVRDL